MTAVPLPDAPGEIDHSAHNILIVDDTPVNLSLVVDYLQSYGFGIRIARSGESALQRVAYDPPDLILLDVLLPGIDGFETCRRLKADERSQDIPVIFMTALTGIQDRVRGFEVGGVDYVTKPLQQEEVLARVTTHLRLRQLTRSLVQKNREMQVRNQIEKERLFEAVSQQREQLQALNSKLTDVQEYERKQLARELHDEMGQALTAISINLASLQQELAAAASPPVRRRLAESLALTDQALEQVREIAVNLRPPMLDDLGLVPTVRWYVNRFGERTGVRTEFAVAGVEERLAPEVETTLYRVIQEALTNSARHADARCVRLRLHHHAGSVRVHIEDDGRGFDVVEILDRRRAPRGMGLLGMHERVTLLGGGFHVDSAPGKGTHIVIDVPARGAAKP